LDAGLEGKAAHPNSRFATPMRIIPCSTLTSKTAMAFPSARSFSATPSDTMPLVFPAFDWEHGTTLGDHGIGNYAAATGAVGRVRRDPMAMLPFCGYKHRRLFPATGSETGNADQSAMIFHVNWFRSLGRKFLWPFRRQHAGIEMDYRSLRRARRGHRISDWSHSADAGPGSR